MCFSLLAINTHEHHEDVPFTFNVPRGGGLDLWADLSQHLAVILSLELCREDDGLAANLLKEDLCFMRYSHWVSEQEKAVSHQPSAIHTPLPAFGTLDSPTPIG